MTLLETIKKDAKASKWVGIFLVIAGFLSLMAPFGAGLSLTLMVGILMLMSGAAQLLVVFRAGSVGQGILMLFFGLLSLVAGGYILSQPVSALAALTLFLAAYFIAAGALQIFAGLTARPEPGWGLVTVGGSVSLVLGAMIWRQFPVSGIWALGTLVGIQLLMCGWTLIAVGGLAKRTVKAMEEDLPSSN